MNIVVVGAGAIGSLWAYQFHQAGHRVSLFTRQTDAQRKLQLNDGPILSLRCNDLTSLQQADLLMVTVKAWQVSDAIGPLIPHLSPDTMLLFMHNGMGALAPLHEHLAPYPVIQAITTHGAYCPEPGYVIHRSHGQTQLGPDNDKGTSCSFLADVLNHALPTVTWLPDLRPAQLKKLAINSVINPLTAIHQCSNGTLRAPQYAAVKTVLIHEIWQIFQVIGCTIDEQTLTQLINEVILATSENYSSMQQDIACHRKTEIDFITGYLLHVAAKHQMALPAHQQLYHSIKALESSWTK